MLCLLSLPAVADPLADPLTEPAETGLSLREVRPGVWVHQGRHLPITHPQSGDIANIGFIAGTRCIAVVDTGGSVATGKALREAISRRFDTPICYVINTHIHFDHLLGNLAFADGETRFVGHAGLAEAVEQNREFFLREFGDKLGESPDENSIIPPSLLVAARMELELGGRTLLLLAFPAAHSHTDLAVLDQKTATLWSGDLIFRQRVPTLTGALRGWLAAMQTLRALEASTIIPGHGEVANSMEDALAMQQNYLERLLVETRKAIQAGQFINDAMEQIDAGNQSGWLLFSERHSANVSRAYTELEWE